MLVFAPRTARPSLTCRRLWRPCGAACHAALPVEELRRRALQLDDFEPRALQHGLAELRAALSPAAAAADDDTLAWFLRDRGLDVPRAVDKAEAYAAWRASGFSCLTPADTDGEAATGKAVLLRRRDALGRPVVYVRVARNVVSTRSLAGIQRLCVLLMDRALAAMQREGVAVTLLAVFDLRGFGTQHADLPFLRFFVRLMLDIYPKRVGAVLLLGAPPVFAPLWAVVRPLLGRYHTLVRFHAPADLLDYGLHEHDLDETDEGGRKALDANDRSTTIA